MEYRYQIISLIIIIALICILYPINTSCKTKGDKIDERFNTNNTLDETNIKLMAELCANRLAVSTYSTVVGPCSRTRSSSGIGSSSGTCVGSTKIIDNVDIIKCITNYDDYYQKIIVDPVSDMFIHMKSLENSFVGYGEIASTSEGILFMTIMSKRYSDTLSKTLIDISNNAHGDNAFEQSSFVPILAQNLTTALIDGVSKAYNISVNIKKKHVEQKKINNNLNEYTLQVNPVTK